MTENNAKPTLIGEVDQTQIDAWKKLHGKVYTYKCDGRICYLKPVGRDAYSLATSKISTSPAKYNETIIEQCWLGGDDTLRTQDNYYFGLKDITDELMDKKAGELGEL